MVREYDDLLNEPHMHEEHIGVHCCLAEVGQASFEGTWWKRGRRQLARCCQ